MFDIRTDRIEGVLCGRLNSHQAVVGALEDLRSLKEQLEALQIDRSTWREGMVTVYDHEGNYVGCMGRESWEWLLAQGYEKCREATERVNHLERLIARCYAGEDFDLLWDELQRPLKEYLGASDQ